MKKRILFSLTLCLIFGTIVQAETQLVPGEYHAIQLAVRDCDDGDVIIVFPGTYYETINFSGKNIILTSTDPNDPNIVAETIIDVDPLFAGLDNADYHLKSQAGRWDSGSKNWVIDDVISPCIDTGDTAVPVGLESSPNGSIVNMGVYGGTTQASRSPVSDE